MQRASCSHFYSPGNVAGLLESASASVVGWTIGSQTMVVAEAPTDLVQPFYL